MTAPEGTGARRPLRTGGLALLGVAAAAALIGLVIVATGDDEPSADRHVPATSEQLPGAETVTPPATLTTSPSPPPFLPPMTSPPGVPTTTPGIPGAPSPTAPAPVSPGPATPVPTGADAPVADSGKGDRTSQVRVYNNSTIRGLAARAARDLAAGGWTVVEVGNYSGGMIPTTTVYYQEGTDQRATAEAIAAKFDMRVKPRFAGITDASPGVIVIVTNDYRYSTLKGDP